MLMTMMIFATTLGAGAPVVAMADADHARDVADWRTQRLERLRSPSGWLSLVGLDWLKPGRNTIGSAPDNDIVIPSAPARLGVVDWQGGLVHITLADPSVTIDGVHAERATLLDDAHESPTTVAFGTTSFLLIDRGGRKGLRIKDSEAQTRTKFAGIEHFDSSPDWRIDARWIAFDPPRTLDIPNVLGTIDKMTVPGKAVFERDGQTYELMPVLESADARNLFFIFADATSGKQTYGGGRFVYADFARDGRVIVDLNKAYNPPCAFTRFATCPLAPPENRLGIAVTAGEKKYRGGEHVDG